MEYVIIRNDIDELYHHGVKGMKWGRRKAQYTSSTSSKFSTGHNKIASMLGNNGKKQVSDSYKRVQITKSNYKQAKKDFNKSYNNAYRYSQAHLIGQYTNKKKKAEKMSKKLEVPYIYFAKKPFKFGFNRAKKIVQENSENIAVIGDQILTDVLGANRSHMYSILVEPLAEKDIFVTRFNRLIERQILKKYKQK